MESVVKKMIIFLFAGSLCFGTLYAQQQCDGLSLYADGIVLMKEKKQYSKAMEKFREASICESSDANLKAKCSDRIAECNQLLNSVSKGNSFSVNKKLIKISANGGNDNVVVLNGKTWTAASSEDWCKVQQSNNSFSVVCEPNESVVERRAIIEVKSGNDLQITEIVQAAGLERLQVTTDNLTFSARGNEEDIQVTSNTRWSFSSIPSWCEITREGNRLSIKAKPNNTSNDRTGSVLISSASKELTVNFLQLASNEGLDVSKKTVSFGYAGGTDEVTVYGNTSNWIIEKFPEWCVVTKKNDYAIAIECLKNNSTKQQEGVILIKTGNNQQVGIKIAQAQGVPERTISIPIGYEPEKDNKVIGGRDISFGITAGLIIPSFSTDASGDYLASAVNYAYDADHEKAKYTSETGFTVGLIADIRLVKNFYLQTGLNYTAINMQNKFDGEYTDEIQRSNTTYMVGQAYDKFTEKYKMNYIEIPFLFSYRFKLSEKTNWQINAGPYIGYALSGKCTVEGTTDWPELDEYYYSNDQYTGNWYFQNCNVTGEFDLFGTSGHRKTAYTTGEMPEYEYDYEFDEAPFKKLNAGLSIGTGFEFLGFNVSVSYDFGLTNIANDDYWKSKRFTVSDYNGTERIKDYKHYINRFQVKIAYIFR